MISKHLIAVLAAFALLAFVSAVQAQPAAAQRLQEASVVFRLPDGWTLQPERGAKRPTWTAVGPDTNLTLLVAVWNDQGAELSEAFDEAANEFNLTGPGEDGPSDVELNGMEAAMAEVSQNEEEGSGLLMVCAPTETLRVVVLCLNADDNSEANEARIRAFVASFASTESGGDDAAALDEDGNEGEMDDDPDDLGGEF